MAKLKGPDTRQCHFFRTEAIHQKYAEGLKKDHNAVDGSIYDTINTFRR